MSFISVVLGLILSLISQGKKQEAVPSLVSPFLKKGQDYLFFSGPAESCQVGKHGSSVGNGSEGLENNLLQQGASSAVKSSLVTEVAPPISVMASASQRVCLTV